MKLTKNQRKELLKWKEHQAEQRLLKYFKEVALGKKEDKPNYDC